MYLYHQLKCHVLFFVFCKILLDMLRTVSAYLLSFDSLPFTC